MRVGFGIDGGGTKSRAMLFEVRTGRVISQAIGGPTNLHSIGLEAAQSNVRQLLGRVCLKAGLTQSDLVCGCLASAGLGRPEEQGVFRTFLSSFLPCPVMVCGDGEALLAGALQSLEGYALIAGTGSIALGRNKDGGLVRSGGLGHMLGDEGSACWMGWEAVRRGFKSLEQRDLPTRMLDRLLGHFALQSQHELIDWFHQRFDKSKVAAAAPLVIQAAEQKDALAMDIVDIASLKLFELLHNVRFLLPLSEHRIALAGGMLTQENLLRRRLLARIAEAWPDARIIFAGPNDATAGACLLANSLIRECGARERGEKAERP